MGLDYYVPSMVGERGPGNAGCRIPFGFAVLVSQTRMKKHQGSGRGRTSRGEVRGLRGAGEEAATNEVRDSVNRGIEECR